MKITKNYNDPGGIQTNNLRNGYKKTKLGVIPVDWSTPTLPEIFKFLRNTSYSRSQMNYGKNEGVYCIHYGDIHATYHQPILDFDDDSNIPKINDEVELSSNIDLLKDGDLIIADASEDYEGIGSAIEIINIKEKDALSGLHTFAFRDYKGETAQGYRAYLFRNPLVKKALKTVATGSKVYGVSKGNLEKFRVVLPTIAEQQKIAKILSTWDIAIEKQERLIAAKETFKRGLMQVLLMNRKRFEGFNGEWEHIELGKLTKVYDGTHSTPKYVSAGIPFYSVENISKEDFENTKFISKEVFEKENKRVKLEENDILMTRIGDIGTPKLLSWKVNASFYVSLALIKKSERFFSPYMEQFIKTEFFQKELFKRTIHVAFPKKINLGEIGDCIIKLPSLKEQKKIACVLSNADKEIALLKQELNELQDQKRGLMQQLLTGEIRVIIKK